MCSIFSYSLRSLTLGGAIAGIAFTAWAVASPAAFAEGVSMADRPIFHEPAVVMPMHEGESEELLAIPHYDTAKERFFLSYNRRPTGDTFRVDPGGTLRIHLKNRLMSLDQPALLSFRPRVIRAQEPDSVRELVASTSAVTNLHTHGFHVSPQGRSDNVLLKINTGKENRYNFRLPPYHAPGTHWYHAHLHGATALQVQGGMVGALIVNEPRGQSLNPTGYRVEEEIMLVKNGEGYRRNPVPAGGFEASLLKATSAQSFAAEPEGVSQALRELIESDTEDELRDLIEGLDAEGSQALVEALQDLRQEPPLFVVNGDENPVIHMTPGAIQRWRVINAGSRNADYKDLFKENHDLYLAAIDGINLTHLPKDKDGNYISYDQDNKLQLAPGNRADVFLIPRGLGTHSLVMEGEMRRGSATPLRFSQKLLTIQVSNPDFSARSAFTDDEYDRRVKAFLDALDANLRRLQTTRPYEPRRGYLRPFTSPPTIRRDVEFDIGPLGDAPPPSGRRHRTFYINGRDYNKMENGQMVGASDYLGRVAGDGGQGPRGQTPWPMRTGTEEAWTIRNVSGQRHPFHIHVNPFWVHDICEKLRADGSCEAGHSVRGQNPNDPRLNRWQDTINLPAGGSVTVWHRISDFDGLLVFHCHILQHEDRGMMINVLIVPKDERDPQAYFDRQRAENARINQEINGP